MSKPFRTNRKTSLAEQLQCIGCEVISTMSALNMEPEPVEEPREGARYLAELDVWAMHAVEHLKAIANDIAHVQRVLFNDRELRFVDDDAILDYVRKWYNAKDVFGGE